MICTTYNGLFSPVPTPTIIYIYIIIIYEHVFEDNMSCYALCPIMICGETSKDNIG